MIVDAALDLFLGSVCAACGAAGRALCRRCDEHLPVSGHLAMPDPTPPGLAPAYAAGPYDDPLKAMVVAHKEHHRLALAKPLGRVLAGVVSGLVAETGGAGTVVALVPVPSRPAVVRARGHDPLLRITRHSASELRRRGHDAGVHPVLRAVRRVADQAGLDAEARQSNLSGAFAARSTAAERLRRHCVVLVDDVVTTGWTLRTAQAALAEAGVAVAGIAAVAATRRRFRSALPIRGQDD